MFCWISAVLQGSSRKCTQLRHRTLRFLVRYATLPLYSLSGLPKLETRVRV